MFLSNLYSVRKQTHPEVNAFLCLLCMSSVFFRRTNYKLLAAYFLEYRRWRGGQSGEIRSYVMFVVMQPEKIFSFPVPLSFISCIVHFFPTCLCNTHKSAKAVYCVSFILFFQTKLYSDDTVTIPELGFLSSSSLSDQWLLPPLHHPPTASTTTNVLFYTLHR